MKRVLIGFLLVLIISFSIAFLPKAKAEKETKQEEYNILVKTNIMIDNATNRVSFFGKSFKSVILYER